MLTFSATRRMAASLKRPVTAWYGHCSGYRIPRVRDHAHAMGGGIDTPLMRVVLSYAATGAGTLASGGGSANGVSGSASSKSRMVQGPAEPSAEEEREAEDEDEFLDPRRRAATKIQPAAPRALRPSGGGGASGAAAATSSGGGAGMGGASASAFEGPTDAVAAGGPNSASGVGWGAVPATNIIGKRYHSAGAAQPRAQSQFVVLQVPQYGGRKVGHVGVFSTGSVVAFDVDDATVAAVVRALQPFERHDPILAAPGAHAPPGRQGTAPSARDLGVHVDRYNYTTIGDLPALGFAAPEEFANGALEASVLRRSGYVDDGTLNALVLVDDTAEAQLPFMYVLAELVLLSGLEARLQPLMEQARRWRRDLEASGRLRCTPHDTRIVKAHALRVSSILSTVGGRADVFWTEPLALQRRTYDCAYEHYEVDTRADALDTKMTTLLRTIAYAADEKHGDVHVRLEWMIVVLIVLSLGAALIHH